MYGEIYKYAAIYINTLCNIYIRKKNIVLTHTAPHTIAPHVRPLTALKINING